MVNMTKNKRAWMRVVEASAAILLIVIVLLTILSKGYIEKADISSVVSTKQVSVLREIELNETLRNSVLKVNASYLPIEMTNISFPLDIKEKISNASILKFLECNARLCKLDNNACILETSVDKEVYVESVIITSNLTTYNPRKLRLFCWVK